MFYNNIMLKLNTFSYIKFFYRNLLTLYLEIFKQKIKRNMYVYRFRVNSRKRLKTVVWTWTDYTYCFENALVWP